MTKHSKTRLNRLDNKLNGFTLIELVVTIAIVSILVATAIPSIQESLRRNRIDTEAQRIFITLNRARNNALTTNSPSYVCRSAPAAIDLSVQLSCDAAGLGGQDWLADLMVYTVISGMGIPAPDAQFENQLLQNLANGQTTASNVLLPQMLQNTSEAPNASLVSTANRDDVALRFNSDGSVQNDTPFRIGICDDGNEGERYGKLIEVNAAGQIRLFSVDVNNPSRNCTPGIAI